MVNKELVEKVGRLGLPLMSPQEDLDVHKTLAEVVQSREVRLWENFPALLANVAKEYPLDLGRVQGHLHSLSDGKAWTELLALSRTVYDAYHVHFAGLDRSLAYLERGQDSAQTLQSFRNAFAHLNELSVADLRLSTERLKHAFEDYMSRLRSEQKQEQSRHEDLSLEFALSQVFSAKQKELFRKKLDGEKLTKTEREYFSRAVKRKVQALANPDLHRLAQKLLG
jgi:hypothetical protein